MNIRPVTAQDFESIYEIYMDEAVNPYMCFEIMAWDAFRPIFEGFLKRDYSWLLEEQGEAAAMCYATIGQGRISHVANLLTLGVKKKHQGKGYGRIIVQQALADLTKAGALRIDLMVEADNEKAQIFYKTMGFTEEARHARYFRRAGSDAYIDEIMMVKML